MSSHTNSSHPPTDKDCPPKHLMHEVECISLVKAVVGLEYTYKVSMAGNEELSGIVL